MGEIFNGKFDESWKMRTFPPFVGVLLPRFFLDPSNSIPHNSMVQGSDAQFWAIQFLHPPMILNST